MKQRATIEVELNRRTTTERAKDKQLTCSLEINISLDNHDRYFCHNTTKSLDHQNHAYVPPKAIYHSKQHLNDKDRLLLNILYSIFEEETQCYHECLNN